MSKPFDYSKWDNIELSDDEADVHPNIDRESWFRMKHRSRVEREENEAKDRSKIELDIAKISKRIDKLKHDLSKIEKDKQAKNVQVKDSDDDESDDDEDFEERKEVLQAELEDLQKQCAVRHAKLHDYERNKKWNVDNMFVEKESRTFINPSAGTTNYTSSGYVKPKEELQKFTGSAKGSMPFSQGKVSGNAPTTNTAPTKQPAVLADATKTHPLPSRTKKIFIMSSTPPPVELGAIETYHEFTEKYADTVELFMLIPDLESSKKFLLRYGDILLQENASNYLLLASLEDEMNGLHEKMMLTARQSQIVTSIAELAKTLKTHPGNVIEPFFCRLQQREHLEEFIKGVKIFQDKIVERAIVKRKEMDATHYAKGNGEGQQDLSDIPVEQRLGPGGLDPLEVIETLPEGMVAAFESRSIDELKEALAKLKPDEADYHMRRCVDSGLWVSNSTV